jgi:ABC-type enterobactin transport system permease subunit
VPICDFGAALILASEVPAGRCCHRRNPIGIVTSSIGALFLVAMLLRSGS